MFVVVFALRGSKVEESEINLSESKINLTFAEDDDSYLKYKNIVEAQVVTSKVLDNKSLEKMREVVKNVFSCDDAILKNVVDPKIIGGFVLTSGTERYDKSLCSAFESLKKKLTNI